MSAVRDRTLVVVLLALAGWALHVPIDQVALHHDRLGYATQAMALAQGQGNTIPMAEERVTGPYPIGVPFLASLAVRVLGPDLRHGVWAILACSLATLALLAHMGTRLWGLAGGVTALLVLWASPIFRMNSGEILSQVPTGLAIILSAWWAARAHSEGVLFAAGLLATLSLLLRWSNATWPMALGLAECLVGNTRTMGRVRSVGVLGAGMAVGCVGLLLHNLWVHGHPLTTAYPSWGYEVGSGFALSHLTQFAEVQMRLGWPLLRSFVGLGTLYPVPVFLAALVGTWSAWTRRGRDPVLGRFCVAAAAGLLLQYGMLAFHFYKPEVYLMPTIPLVVIMAVAGARHLCGSRRAWLLPALALVLLLSSGLRRAEPPDRPTQAALARYDRTALAGQRLPPDAVFVTTGDPPLVETLFRTKPGRSVLYLKPHAGPRQATMALKELGAPEETPQAVVAYVHRRLEQGRPVYLDLDPPRLVPQIHRPLFEALQAAFRRQASPVPKIFELHARPRPLPITER